MKLYRTTLGTWAGTQADAKAIAKDQDPSGFETVEVPTDKPGLLEFLNEHMGSDTYTESPAVEQTPTVASPPPVPGRIQSLQMSFEKNIRLEDEIANADLPRTVSIASHALCRLQEHVNRIGKT